MNAEKREQIFKVVKAQKLIDELVNPLESKFVKMLGWDYRNAVAIAREQGGVILYTCHPDAPWRFVGFEDFEMDERAAFEVIAVTYESYGGVLLCEEFIPLPSDPPPIDDLR